MTTRLTQRSYFELRPWAIVTASVLLAAVILTAASASDICMGDEIAHVNHARAYKDAGRRLPYHPTFFNGYGRALQLAGTPLWHTGLAALWKLTGSESRILTQSYHAGFYLLLLLCVYFGTNRIWGRSAASWAWLLAAGAPMVCAYSIVLYQDVPGIAMISVTLLLLWRRNFLLCGVCLAASYFTKMNTLSYAPWAVVFAAWWAKGTWKQRAVAAVLVLLPTAMVFSYDVAWRWHVYGEWVGDTGPSLVGDKVCPPALLVMRRTLAKDFVYWKPYPFHTAKSALTHLGVPLMVGIVLALIRAWDTISKWLWVCLLLAVGGFLLVFVRVGSTQMRYLMPAILVAILLSARAFSRWHMPRWITVVLVAGCVFQFIATNAYMCRRRRIGAHDRQAFDWIVRNTDESARFMFPELLLRERTGRAMLWHALNPAYFMADAPDEMRTSVLRWFSLTHIAIPMRRTYDPQKEGMHYGGYSLVFLKLADSLPYLEKVYENPGFVIYRVILPPEPATRPADEAPAGE